MGRAANRKKTRRAGPTNNPGAPPPSGAPRMHPEDARLLAAYDRLLEEAVGYVRAADIRPTTPGDVVVLGVAARVLQLAHAVHSLCASGHAGEAPALGRSILNGTASLVAICDRDRE